MTAALILLAILAAVGIVLYTSDRVLHGSSDSGSNDDTADAAADSCSADCCSTNDVCPSERLLLGISSEPAYFNDEELDSFKGRAADSYTADEVDAFRDVLYTLRKDELLAWQQSVKKRGITMPTAIHDEFIMLYNESDSPQADAIKHADSR